MQWQIVTVEKVRHLRDWPPRTAKTATKRIQQWFRKDTYISTSFKILSVKKTASTGGEKKTWGRVCVHHRGFTTAVQLKNQEDARRVTIPFVIMSHGTLIKPLLLLARLQAGVDQVGESIPSFDARFQLQLLNEGGGWAGGGGARGGILTSQEHGPITFTIPRMLVFQVLCWWRLICAAWRSIKPQRHKGQRYGLIKYVGAIDISHGSMGWGWVSVRSVN